MPFTSKTAFLHTSFQQVAFFKAEKSKFIQKKNIPTFGRVCDHHFSQARNLRVLNYCQVHFLGSTTNISTLYLCFVYVLDTKRFSTLHLTKLLFHVDLTDDKISLPFTMSPTLCFVKRPSSPDEKFDVEESSTLIVTHNDAVDPTIPQNFSALIQVHLLPLLTSQKCSHFAQQIQRIFNGCCDYRFFVRRCWDSCSGNNSNHFSTLTYTFFSFVFSDPSGRQFFSVFFLSWEIIIFFGRNISRAPVVMFL